MRPIPAFVAIVTALGAAIGLIVAWTGGMKGPLAPLAFATMAVPAVSAYVLRAAANEGPRIDWSRLSGEYLPVALFLIPAVMHAAMLPAMHAVAGRLPWTAHPAWAPMIVNAIVGLLVVSALALFEEIGWRGWLLPRLLERYDGRIAIALTSGIWAAWHVPFVLSGILAADGVSSAHMAAIEVIGVGGAGLVLGWLWVRTESVWIVAIAHGAMNNWGQYAFKFMDAGPGIDLTPVLLAGSIAVLVAGVALVWGLPLSRPRMAAAAAVLVTLTQTPPLSPLDYPQWRGQDRDGSASEFTAPPAWPAALTRQWRVDVGEGYSGPIVAGRTVYAFARRDGSEVLTALAADTGAARWRTSYPAPYTVNDAAARHGAGPKATPLLYRGRIFTMGISGIVSAFDATTGARVWQTPPPAEAAIFGAASSPLGEGDLVLLHPGNYGPLTAFDAATGTVRWTAGDDGLFASPIAATLDGVRQIVTVTQSAIIGVSPGGAVLWKYPFRNNGAGTPVLYNDTVVVGGLDLGFVAIRPRRSAGGWIAEKVWETSAASTYFGTPVVADDVVYGLSDKASGQFFALDAATGRTLWLGPPRQAAGAAIGKARGLLFLLEDSGDLIVARASRAAFEPLQTYTVSTSATWGQPAISGSRILVKDASSVTLWTVR